MLSIRHLATATLALALLTACSTNPRTNTPAPATAANHAFIDGMVPHHQMAMKAADSALARAVHPELKQYAMKLRADQAKEVAQMKSWKQQWFGTDSTPMSMTPGTFPPDSAFDLGWIKMIVAHHQQAIDMASLALEAGLRPQADSLARQMITEQKQEQAQLRSWAQQWYGTSAMMQGTMSGSPARP